MGVLVIGLNVITNVWLAAPFLILLGAIGGYLVVPMNALLQHRGANLMGAGRSIAVQNFNEQACILGLGAFYTGMTRFGLSAFAAIAMFGVLVAGTMWLIRRWHQSQLREPSRTRSSTCWRSRASTSIDAPPVAGRAAGLAALALVFNALVWGTSWWPFRWLQARGAASALGHGADLHARLGRDRRASGRARSARCCARPALWVLVAGRGHDQRRVQLGRGHRRRRPRRAAVLPDAALDRAARARCCSASASRARRRCASVLALAGAAIVLWPEPARRRRRLRRQLPLPRSLADWLAWSAASRSRSTT